MRNVLGVAGVLILGGCVVPITSTPTAPVPRPVAQHGQAGGPALPSTPSPTHMTIRATAPQSMGDHRLGRPYDASFQDFRGQDGRTLFESIPDAAAAEQATLDAQRGLREQSKGVIVTKPNIMRHNATVIEDARSLRANARAWFLSGEVSNATQQRYATYSAMQIAEIHEVDDTMSIRTPPPGAVWYVSKIYYGRSYQVVLSGTQETFHAGVKAEFLKYGGGIETFAQEHSLRTTMVGRGMVPNGEAIFARSPEEVASTYTEAEELAPIFVEYTLIPGVHPPEPEMVAWNNPPAVFKAGRYRVRSVNLIIGKRSSGGTYWDPDGDLPDPAVKLSVDGNEIATCREQDWEITKPVDCRVDKIINISSASVLRLNVVDRDAFSDDSIGTASWKPSGSPANGVMEMEATGDITRVMVTLDGPL